MSVLRSRRMPLIVSSLLFVNFLFATIPLGQGLKCYSCVSIHNKNCTNHPELVESIECGAPISTTTTPETTTTQKPAPETTTTQKPAPETTTTQKPAPETTTTQKPAPETTTTQESAPEIPPPNGENGSPLHEFLELEVYAGENDYTCFYISGKLMNQTDTVVARGCAQKKDVDCNKIKAREDIKDAVCWTCESENCNPANGIQIGVITLFMPLIAYLLATR